MTSHPFIPQINLEHPWQSSIPLPDSTESEYWKLPELSITKGCLITGDLKVNSQMEMDLLLKRNNGRIRSRYDSSISLVPSLHHQHVLVRIGELVEVPICIEADCKNPPLSFGIWYCSEHVKSSIPSKKSKIPPQILTMILECAMRGTTIKELLCYRLVSSKWKETIDSLLEKSILAGQRKPIPRMGAGETYKNLPCVLAHVLMLQGKANPLPFNALRVDGSSQARTLKKIKLEEKEILMSLPHFLSTVGRNLTSFLLYDQDVDFNILVSMFGSMPLLKLLDLSFVRISTDMDIEFSSLRSPPLPLPKLPKLQTLRLSSHSKLSQKIRDTNEFFFTWLVASYADQLVTLNLCTEDPFPYLRQSDVVGCYDHMLCTSDSAFGNMRKLTVSDPSMDFLQLTIIPAIQELCFQNFDKERASEDPISLQDFTDFIDRCAATLEKLCLKLDWGVLVGRKFLPKEMIVLPRLKLLTICNPQFDNIIILKNFLTKFPALQELRLFSVNLHGGVWNTSLGGGIRREVARDRKYQLILDHRPGLSLFEAVVRDWIQEYGFWNICPELKLVVAVELGDANQCNVVRPFDTLM
ncbi:unnamed protein product [Orchesella dallaii]|uniref:F-box domain-containing protein n=1 Tax=Orchesella dallaii TaxID=48710 RepID=A0ABP1RGF4_9HEXA